MVENVSLAHFDTARRELELASSIDEVKTIRDQAEAIRQYIKQQKGSLEMQNHAAEIKLRAERRAGEMLKEPEIRQKPGEYKKLHDVTFSPKPSLEDLGITKMQSHRWQLEAEIPKQQFEAFIQETKAAADEITSREALRLAMKLRHDNKKKPTSDPAMPDGLFDVIVVDPPWPYGTEYNPESRRVGNPYFEWTIDEIMAMEIPYAENCILWLWTTNKFMHDAFHIMDTWGFEQKSILTWFKERTGVGCWLRGQTEHCLFGVRGQPRITHVAQGTALFAKAGKHSEKPQEFYDLVESLCPGKKLDIFGRKQRQGWDVYGDQL